MSGILTPGDRPGEWQTIGDLQRRVQRLEALPALLAPDCGCVPDTPPTLLDIILAEPCLVALWQLDETSGDIAADSAPGGFDQNSGAYSPPTWATATTPFGTDAPTFGNNLGESRAAFAALTGDLTAEIWFQRTNVDHGQMLGQGNPESSNTSGWNLAVGAFNEGAFNRPKVYIGDTTGGPHGFEADTAITNDGQWHHLATTRASNVWRLYLDAVLQSGSYNDSGTNYSSTTGIWTGNNPSDVGQLTEFNGYLAYAAVYSCALSAGDIENHYSRGIAGLGIPNGWVLTADDTAEFGWSWQPPTIEVEF